MCSLLGAALIAAEFEDMYNVGHEGRTTLFDLGIFGGSNGYWEAPLLKEIQMDGSMLTEDIDSSFRATLKGARIAYAWQVSLRHARTVFAFNSGALCDKMSSFKHLKCPMCVCCVRGTCKQSLRAAAD